MEEPNALIRWTIFFFASGDSAIAGVLGITAIAILRLCFHRRRPVRPFWILTVFSISLILIICGSPPVPTWFQISTAIWIVAVAFKLNDPTVRLPAAVNQKAVRQNTLAADSDLERQMSSRDDRAKKIDVPAKVDSKTCDAIPPRAALLWSLSPFVWLMAVVAIELPFQIWFPSAERISSLLIIGDSVTAGLNDGEDTWPKRLSRVAKVEVLDASQPGATLQSATKQNSRLMGHVGTVVLEIGGNDMLESLPIKQFEQNLDRLLTDVDQPGRTIVMFELPLPPMSASYGSVQRRQAANHRIKLIPKRQFATILTTRGSTVDGIHLSAQGQTLMMELIQNLFKGRFESGMGTYQHFESVTN